MQQAEERETPQVSVVIASYNSSLYTERAVRSVEEQRFPGYEIVLVDDASTQEHAARLDSLAEASERVRLIRHEKNQGVRPARRHGWEAARAPLVSFLDDDDVYLPGYLDASTHFLHQHPEYGAVYTRYHLISLAGTERRTLPAKGYSGRIFRQTLKKGIVKTSTLMVRRRALLELEGILEQMRTSGDYDIVLRLAYKHPFGFIEQPLVEVTSRADSVSRDTSRRQRNRIEILRNLMDNVVPDMAPGDRKAIRRKLAGYYLKWARREIAAGRRDEARTLYRKGIGASCSLRLLLGYLGSFLPCRESRRADEGP